MKPKHDSIRGWFASSLYDEMEKDNNIWVITADLGYGMFDQIRDDYPNRFINCGAAEQCALGTAIGLSLSGKIVFVYSITTFLIYRSFEWIRNYLHYEQIPVFLIGSGLDDDYKHDGITHQPYEVKDVLNVLSNIHQYYPSVKTQVPALLRQMIEENKPAFMCLRR